MRRAYWLTSWIPFIEHTSYPVQSLRSGEVLIEEAPTGVRQPQLLQMGAGQGFRCRNDWHTRLDNWAPEHEWAELAYDLAPLQPPES